MSERLREEVRSTHGYASEAGWDGYNGAPVNTASSAHAAMFAVTLPDAFDALSVGVDPDGDVTFEWSPRKGIHVSMSVDERGAISIAALLDGLSYIGTLERER